MGSRYCISDLHGNLKLYQEIKKFLKPDDMVFCLGDCGDRGPNGWETIKAVIKDPQFIYLKGNHEDMLVAAMAEYLGLEKEVKTCMTYKNPLNLLIYNGGENTFEGWKNEPDEIKEFWMYHINNLPLYHEAETAAGDRIILTHAGYTPPAIPFAEDLIWGRTHFTDKWPEGFDNTFIIHGHTPCLHLNNKWTPYDGAMYYALGHKIDIDMGTVGTGVALLFNLDTFDEHIFSIEGR